jgi:hypothetical protein
MKYCKLFLILTLTIIVSLLVVTVPWAPGLAAESITIYPDNGLPGTNVRVSGTGFIAGHNIGVYFDGTTMTLETITSTTFDIYFDVPDDAEPGSYRVEVIDWDAVPPQTVASDWFTVTGGTIDLDLEVGPVGTAVEINGDNFSDREDIIIEYDGDEIEIQSGDDRTDTNGEFTCIIIIPESTRGDHTISVEDESSIYAEAEFAVEPEITIDPTSGVGGDEVVVSGTGFRASRSMIITFDGDNVTTSPPFVGTDGLGSFRASFNIPVGTKGNYTVEASDGTYEANANLALSLSFSISETSGYVGTDITVNGTGFRASRPISITFDNIQVGTTTTNTSGYFTDSFLVPGISSGTYQVRVSDGVNTSSIDFIVRRSFSISDTSGYIGDEIVISGTGFRASLPVIITFDDVQVGTNNTDANGTLNGSFFVPGIASGTYQVRVSDGVSMAEVDFTVLINASLSPTTSHISPGHVDTVLSISGVGFNPNGTITIKYDNIQVATTFADSSGVFSATINVPASIGGDHIITVSDTYNIEQFTFTMESTPPPVPKPKLPEMATKAKPEVFFDWESVNDPSGVTYTLQIATDADFNNIVVEKVSLIDSKYTLTEEEKLASVSKEEPYYWRIRAIDGASNESEWTVERSFHVGFIFAMPSWAIYLLFGIGALLCGVLGFWLGRKTTDYSY